MALQKTIEHSSGASSTYWRVLYVITDYQFNRATIIMGGYTSEQARLDNKEPLVKSVYNIVDPDFTTWFDISTLDQSNTNHIKNSYLLIKIIDSQFSDATDV